MKYKVTQKSYWGAPGERAELRHAGDVYINANLSDKDKPKWLEPIGEGVAVKPAPAPKKEEETGEVPMSYQEMKTFVADNGIDVPDQKKPTLEAAIAAFKAGETSEPEGEEGDSEEGSEEESSEEEETTEEE